MLVLCLAGNRGGNDVEVEGSFDNWSTRTRLQKTGNSFTIIKLLPPGVYQYKFIVDNEWQYDPSQPAIYDDSNNVNNVIEVQEFVPENLDSLTGFDQPPSPEASYDRAEPSLDDFQKEPPTMPPHLNLALLNVPPALEAQAVLPRPLHVVLNHTYLQKDADVRSAVYLRAFDRCGGTIVCKDVSCVLSMTPHLEIRQHLT